MDLQNLVAGMDRKIENLLVALGLGHAPPDPEDADEKNEAMEAYWEDDAVVEEDGEDTSIGHSDVFAQPCYQLSVSDLCCSCKQTPN